MVSPNHEPYPVHLTIWGPFHLQSFGATTITSTMRWFDPSPQHVVNVDKLILGKAPCFLPSKWPRQKDLRLKMNFHFSHDSNPHNLALNSFSPCFCSLNPTFYQRQTVPLRFVGLHHDVDTTPLAVHFGIDHLRQSKGKCGATMGRS